MDEKYAEYLCSREWGLKREAVIARANGICERCIINPGSAVHHKTYARIYHEELTDLEFLCNPCHDFTHGRNDVDPREKVHRQAYNIVLRCWLDNHDIKSNIIMSAMAEHIGEYCACHGKDKQEVEALLTSFIKTMRAWAFPLQALQ